MAILKNKIYDWKDRLRKGKMLTLITSLIVIILVLTVYSLKKGKDYRQMAENSYNEAFYELIEYVNNTEKLLAKATISTDSKHGAKILMSIWRTATLAQSYISRIPIPAEEMENTQKFLNQVGDYAFTLSKKNIDGENLSKEDINNLKGLHDYSIELSNTLTQLESDLNQNSIRWGELTKKGSKALSEDEKNLSQTSFSNIEEDLHQYTGLIYDGAFSENQSEIKGYGLTGEEINDKKALEIAENFIGKDRIKITNFEGESEEAKIPCYDFNCELKNELNCNISISKKGGHVVNMNCNREVLEKQLNEEEAIKCGKEFLEKRDYKEMKETYCLNQGNILTINYAYTKNDVIIYPDLIKVKIALDNGEVLGIETTNYLNSHRENRVIKVANISKEKAIELVNPDLQITGANLAIIPTEWNTEIFCWEIKGKAYDNDFLVYVNAENGKEEDILMIVDTPNGKLTT